ncbi:PGF-pre-PGF domain-containing protein [Candidatus Woesearchaeota archaeon]|nr:PGF-pre-PGF domain-containing protein [Candidatus Woesearchaeota archaeon]
MKLKYLVYGLVLLFLVSSVLAANYGAGKYGEGKYGVGPVAASSSSGGGGGGSTGSSSSNPTTTSTVLDVSKGQEARLTFDGAKSQIIDIVFTVSRDVSKIVMSATDVDVEAMKVIVAQPLDVTVYKYFNIKFDNLDNTILSGNAKIKFDVEKSWLTNSNVESKDVVFYRYNEGKWDALPTQYVSESDNFIRFLAETPGFSYFAIGNNKKIVLPAPGVETPQPSAPVTGEAIAQQPEKVKTVEEKKAMTPAMTAIIVLLVIVLVALVIYFGFIRKKNNKF